MISEKEMMIVDAVNKSKCEIKALGPNKCNTHVSAVTKNNVIHKEGEVFLTSKVFDNNCWVNICTIEEYNQCIREMSEGAFVPDAKPEFVYGQDVYVEDTKGVEWLFGCYLVGKELAIVIKGSHQYACVSVKTISTTPFRSKEDIELEEAKYNQVMDLADIIQSWTKDGGDYDPVAFANHLQIKGFLAEILLPLEPKQ